MGRTEQNPIIFEKHKEFTGPIKAKTTETAGIPVSVETNTQSKATQNTESANKESGSHSSSDISGHKPDTEQNGGSESALKFQEETKRRTIVKITPIDLSPQDPETQKKVQKQMEHYFALLNKPENRMHFTGLPKPNTFRTKEEQAQLYKEFLDSLSNRRNHPIAGINELGESIAFCTISDAEPGQHDHFIGKLVVDPKAQNKRKFNEPKDYLPHTGTQFLQQVIKWAFDPANKTYDDRIRTKIDTAIIMVVPDSERVYNLFDRQGFVSRMINPDQADVYDKDGEVVTKPVIRLELKRSDWEAKQQVQAASLIIGSK